MKLTAAVSVLVALIMANSSLAFAQEIDFENDIWSVFQARCADCHSGEEAEARFRVDAKHPFMAGGVSGSVVNREEPLESLLLMRLMGVGDLDQMPPDDDPLEDEEIALIRKWLESGAEWPDGIGEEVQVETHWAYVPPVRPTIPVVNDTEWPLNALDYFVLSKLEARDWRPSDRASDETLIRRLYLDLVGYPPTPEDVATFLADSRPNRYEILVDRLLASPQYGVRWARPWLDQARYADSNGYQADQYREVWAYRDWVIRSINGDMPFDRFTIDQLAGDLVESPTLDQKIATGFHRLTTCNVEAGVDPEENRVNQILDRVNTTGTVWLGTTIECAQCHNHKYDPFTQRDYYSFFAYFNQSPLEVKDSGNTIQFEFVGPKMSLPLSKDQQRQRSELNETLTQLRADRESATNRLMMKFDAWVDELVERSDAQPRWQTLDVAAFHSSGGSTGTKLDDQSLLIGGANPDKDDYTIAFEIEEGVEIRALKLETLTDDSLPGRGPGRHDPERPNFVLYELDAKLASRDGFDIKDHLDRKPFEDGITFSNAVADFSQNNWHVKGLVDGDRSTGWAINPKFHEDHWAVIETRDPISLTADSLLVLQFDQHYGGTRTIGRLRISVSDQPFAAESIDENLIRIARIEKAERKPGEARKLEEAFLQRDSELQDLNSRIAETQKQLNAIAAPTTLVMIENEEMRETHVFVRGDFLSPSDSVEPSTPSILPAPTPDLPKNRLGLAQWLVADDNPLTSRVITNRWWSEFFGHGLVVTQEDFGTQGDMPTHPDLLDWLAVEFRDNRWSMKHIHRLIVTSATYRQSSRCNPQLLEDDPTNRWYARASRFRLPAESIRDNGLQISGNLSFDMEGPPIYPPQPAGVWRHVGRNAPKYLTSTGNDRFRRGIYVVWRRSAPYPSFVNFDAPDRASCVVNRPRTNTPLQALTLLNDPAYVELIDAFEARLRRNYPLDSLDARLAHAFQSCVARQPSVLEMNYLRSTFWNEFAAHSDTLLKVERQPATANEPEDIASLLTRLSERQKQTCDQVANRFVATVLLNLDETITRE